MSPPPRLTVSEWADAERRLSPEASAEAGWWNTDRAAYQRGIMDCINDPAIENIVIMSAAQIGKTEILLNILGYYISHDPSPILVLQPTLSMAQAFSKDRLAPMLRDTPCLAGKVQDPRSRDSNNTTLHKAFSGGHLNFTGSAGGGGASDFGGGSFFGGSSISTGGGSAETGTNGKAYGGGGTGGSSGSTGAAGVVYVEEYT